MCCRSWNQSNRDRLALLILQGACGLHGMERKSHPETSDAITASPLNCSSIQSACGVSVDLSHSRDESIERLVEQILIESGVPPGRRNPPQFGTASMTLLSLA